MSTVEGTRTAVAAALVPLPRWSVVASSVPAAALLFALLEGVYFMSMDWRGGDFDFVTGTEVGLFLIALAALPAVTTAAGWVTARRWRASGAALVGLGIVGAFPSLWLGVYLARAAILR